MTISVNATKEALAAEYTGLGSWISVHTADPGSTGASEATGGSPAYARKQTTWSAGAVDGVYTGTPVTFDLPAGTYANAGIFSASSGGTFVDKAGFPSTVLNAQGQITFTPTYTQT